MQLQVSSPKHRFIVNEALVFKLTIRNNGASPAMVPEIADSRNRALTYELEGPAVAGVYRFKYGSMVEMMLPGGPEQQEVAPGQSIEEPVDIVSFVPVWKPGDYTLRIQLDEDVSPPFAFTVEPPQIKSAQILSDGAGLEPGMMRLAFLEGDGNIYQGFYSEADGTVETPPTRKFVLTSNVPAGAESVLIPATNFNRGSVMFVRCGWQSKDEIGMADISIPSLMRFPLHGERVLRPSLMVQSGEAYVFLLKEQELTLVTIPRPASGTPRLVWSAALPGAAETGAAALGPINAGSPMAAAVAIPRPDGISIAVARDGTRLHHDFKDLYALPHSVPALAIAHNGDMRISLLVSDSPDLTTALTLDLLWRADQLLPDAARSAPIRLQGGVAAAATVFAPIGEPPRRDWVLAFEDGSVLSSREPHVRRRFGSAPVLPLQLLARNQQTYLLVHDPNHILDMVHLH